MSGNAIGAAKIKAILLAKDPNYFATIGRKGGQNGHTGGFASDKMGKDGLTGRQRAASFNIPQPVVIKARWSILHPFRRPA